MEERGWEEKGREEEVDNNAQLEQGRRLAKAGPGLDLQLPCLQF